MKGIHHKLLVLGLGYVGKFLESSKVFGAFGSNFCGGFQVVVNVTGVSLGNWTWMFQVVNQL